MGKIDINNCMIKPYVFLFVLCFNVIALNAQNKDSFSVEIKWNGLENIFVNGNAVKCVSFENAVYDNYFDEKNPFYRTTFPIYSDEVEIDAYLDNLTYEEIPENELSFLNESEIIDTIPLYNYYIKSSRDNHSLCFEINPFFKVENVAVRLVSCDVHYSIEGVKRNRSYYSTDNSVLASGNWYKMSLSSTGMYKITYSELSSMGVPVASINPKNIRLYHNGGGILPVINNEKRHDDLVEIPIFVSGENDGSFDLDDYIVFYGRGPVTLKNVNGIYEKVTNPYSDYSYVFLTTDLGEGKRIENAESIAENHDVIVDSFLDYQLVEDDTYNLNNMGATWYGDKFDAILSRSYSFVFPNLIKEKKCNLYSEVASRNFSRSEFNYKANGSMIYKLVSSTNASDGLFANMINTGNVKFNSDKDQIIIELSYSRTTSTSTAWLDYIGINAWRELKFTEKMMLFRNPDCFSKEKIYKYEIGNVNKSLQVWDVTEPTEPKNLELEFSSNKAYFKTKGSQQNEFIAFDGNYYNKVNFVSKIANQNLHSKYDFDYLIITHPDFYSQSLRLKEIHSRIDDLKIEIVTPQQIYNEFSCGTQDITAIRDYIRMLYKKSNKRLRYVLLFGDASYDFKNKSGQVCFIPSYESKTSCSSACVVSDDYFVCLDDNEGIMNNTSVIDLAIGRMPVATQEDASAMIDKIEQYISITKESAGQWRKNITFVADDDDTYYASHAEQLENIIRNNGGEDVDIDKIYLDAYPQIATSSGQRSPECNAAITNRVELGASIINYIGHAGEVGWAAERILTNEDIFSWQNSPKLHLMITASCEFSRFDDHTRTSAGEYVFLNHHGGAIAMMTTARVTYASNSIKLMKLLYEHLFDVEGGKYITMGDVFVHAKQVGDENSKVYVYFGDPALRLNYPENIIELTSINNHDVIQNDTLPNQADTLRALQNVNIKGVVNDMFGTHLSDFNGVLHINVYDKDVTYNTHGNETNVISFKLRNSVIYTGKAEVKDGMFSADFTLPKDINYSYGEGLISLYAYSEDCDAHGAYSNIIVGGLNEAADTDNLGPEIKLYIDDERFVDGSMTNENPLLLAYIKDENGVNTSGAGIGHDITATLSGATNKVYTLNQFYEAPLSKDESGLLSYKFYGLNEGEHTLTFKVWDIHNNSSTATIRFDVVKGKVIYMENITNYPNPMNGSTNFTFEHNQKDNQIDVVIKIYNVVGQLVKTITEHRYGTTARIEPIKWDGRSDGGTPLKSGVYVYNVTIKNSQSEETSGYSKLIIE
ncbi:MAG: type IX secretion system sortase PorU [Bacteroidales bacterium]|nr:type IX secretion system sortase PorU [Bacteroidales bacterium]